MAIAGRLAAMYSSSQYETIAHWHVSTILMSDRLDSLLMFCTSEGRICLNQSYGWAAVDDTRGDAGLV